MAEEKSQQPQVLERGHMYLLFRPKIDVEEAHALKDVEKLYIWLAPDRVSFAGMSHAPPSLSTTGKERAKYHRLIIMPRKALPHHSARERLFTFVDFVCTSASEMSKHLGEIHYHTKTRGDRTIDAARVVAEAIYEIVVCGDRTYLTYELEFPSSGIHEAQKVFNIEQKAMFMIQAKNPHAEVTPGAPHINKKVSFPASLMEHFKGKRVAYTKYASLLPAMLDYEGLEMIWFGAHAPAEVLGDDMMEDLDEMVAMDMKKERVKTDEDAKQNMQMETGREVMMDTLER